MVTIEFIYVAADNTVIQLYYQVAPGTTIAQALTDTNLFTLYPVLKTCAWGIFSKKATLDTVVIEGDRIEFYRPLLIDPKDKRRARATSSRVFTKGQVNK